MSMGILLDHGHSLRIVRVSRIILCMAPMRKSGLLPASSCRSRPVSLTLCSPLLLFQEPQHAVGNALRSQLRSSREESTVAAIGEKTRLDDRRRGTKIDGMLVAASIECIVEGHTATNVRIRIASQTGGGAVFTIHGSD